MSDQMPVNSISPETIPVVPTPGTNSASRTSLLVVLIVGLVISAGGALLYWQNRQLSPPDRLAELVEPTPIETRELPPSGEAIPNLVYSLPANWTEQPAEGDLTPYYTFLKRLRSPDDCNLVVVARFRTGDLSLNDFLATQYPGSTLAQLRHTVPTSLAGLDSFTVGPQAPGEAFSTFIKGENYIYGLFASYSLDTLGTTPRCEAETPELASLLNSVKLE